MSYDPIRDAPGFRTTLRRLADVEHLTSQAIVDLFNRNRARGDNLSISRATLDRFVQGEDITKIRELRAIHDLLRANPAYGNYFAASDAGTGMADTPPSRAIAGFFAIAATGADDSLPRQTIAALPGRYILMRRDHDPVTVDRGVRVSSLSVGSWENGIAVEETQSYRTLDDDVPIEQTDRGYIFAHGPYLYFLMKEIGGTAVKFGVIEQTMPDLDRAQPIQYFQGHITVVSRRGVFPAARFAARRYSPNQHPVTSGIVSLPALADPRAAEFLKGDFSGDAASAIV